MAEAGAFKILSEDDIVSTRTLLHEAIPITGTIVSGTYNERNIKNPSHGMFQSVYDYPFLSSSSNHIFDITVGVSTNSGKYNATNNQASKKKNVYNQMAQILVGYDITGSVLRFDEDGDLTGGTKIDNAIFIPFSRLLVKDEIKKGTFSMTLGLDSSHAAPFNGNNVLITDASGSNNYFVNSPAGEYGILYADSPADASGDAYFRGYKKCGLIYYQAGIVVLTASVFSNHADTGLVTGSVNMVGNSDAVFIDNQLTGSTIQTIANSVRHRIGNIQFNNTTELNSTIYFCRANHNEFNYSTNPTYLTGSKIRVKTNSTDQPISYITSIGLYNDRNELMAVAKLSEPLKKTPSTEFTLRCRLDY